MAKKGARLSGPERRLLKAILNRYDENRVVVEVMLKQLSDAILSSPALMTHVHSTRGRLKETSHLEKKLYLKMVEAKEKGKAFPITEANLLYRIKDLAGFRILHLHTRQIIDIDRELRKVLAEYRFPLFEKPTARTWDDESRADLAPVSTGQP